jgi:hypothetical protein
MILREFDLDLPFIKSENNIQVIMDTQKCSSLEATPFDSSVYTLFCGPCHQHWCTRVYTKH